MKLWIVLLILLGGTSCITKKYNGFAEIAELHPEGLQMAVESDEGAAFVRALGRYINQLEQELEQGD